MKNTKFTLFELFAMICLLASIIITTTVTFPKFTRSREQAFRVEATRVVEDTEEAIKRIKDKKLQITNDDNSCNLGEKYCFTVKELIDLELYDGNPKNFSGKVEIDYTNPEPTYNVFFKKNDEFKIIYGFRKSYIDFGKLSQDNWLNEFETCNCEEIVE